MSKTLYVLCGPSGSGKTTAREALISLGGAPAVGSADDSLMKAASASGITYQQAYALHSAQAEAQFQEEVLAARRAGRDLIVDRTNLTVDKRRPLIEAFRGAGYEVVAVVPSFDVSSEEGVEELLRRARERTDRGAPMPGFVIEQQIASYEPPSTAEGFDRVVTVEEAVAAASPSTPGF